MFHQNSTPRYRVGIDAKEYLRNFQSWLYQLQADSSCLHTIRRFLKFTELNLLPQVELSNLVYSLRHISEDVGASQVKIREIKYHLKDLENRIHTACPLCKLITTLSHLQHEKIEFTDLIQSYFVKIKDEEISRNQAELIMRDLATTTYSTKEDLQEIFSAWT